MQVPSPLLSAAPAGRGTAGECACRHLERRWAAEATARLAGLEVLLARQAALLAAVHYSRSVARHRGWEPWRALLQRATDQVTAADRLHARHCLSRALAAWERVSLAAAWWTVAAEACAYAAARRQRQTALMRHALVALQQQVAWARSLPQRHTYRLAARALHCWRRHAAAAGQCTQRQLNVAANHVALCTCRRTLTAWQLGVVRGRHERVVAARREVCWGTAQRYLQEHRQAKALVQGSGGLLPSNLSSAENMFDPNTIFFGGVVVTP